MSIRDMSGYVSVYMHMHVLYRLKVEVGVYLNHTSLENMFFNLLCMGVHACKRQVERERT